MRVEVGRFLYAGASWPVGAARVGSTRARPPSRYRLPRRRHRASAWRDARSQHRPTGTRRTLIAGATADRPGRWLCREERIAVDAWQVAQGVVAVVGSGVCAVVGVACVWPLNRPRRPGPASGPTGGRCSSRLIAWPKAWTCGRPEQPLTLADAHRAMQLHREHDCARKRAASRRWSRPDASRPTRRGVIACGRARRTDLFPRGADHSGLVKVLTVGNGGGRPGRPAGRSLTVRALR